MNSNSSSIKIYSYTKTKNLFLVEFAPNHSGWRPIHDFWWLKDRIFNSIGYGSSHIALNGKRLRWKEDKGKIYYNNITKTEHYDGKFFDILKDHES